MLSKSKKFKALHDYFFKSDAFFGQRSNWVQLPEYSASTYEKFNPNYKDDEKIAKGSQYMIKIRETRNVSNNAESLLGQLDSIRSYKLARRALRQLSETDRDIIVLSFHEQASRLPPKLRNNSNVTINGTNLNLAYLICYLQEYDLAAANEMVQSKSNWKVQKQMAKQYLLESIERYYNSKTWGE